MSIDAIRRIDAYVFDRYLMSHPASDGVPMIAVAIGRPRDQK
jgi:hypothetical protein